jgi:hypothetical protein
MIADLYNIFLLIDDKMKPENISNSRTLKSEEIDDSLAKHARSRHYSYHTCTLYNYMLCI